MSSELDPIIATLCVFAEFLVLLAGGHWPSLISSCKLSNV